MINSLFTQEVVSKEKYIALPNAEDPRLILPIANRRVFRKGFEIHNTASPSNRLLKRIVSSFSFLLPLLQSKTLYPTHKFHELFEIIEQNINQRDINSISVYVGTKNSSNRKLTLQLMDCDYNIIGYVKLADSTSSNVYIKNEYEILNTIRNYTLENTIYPQKQKIFSSDNYFFLFLDNIYEDSIYNKYEINELIFNGLLEIAEKTRKNYNLQRFYETKKIEIKKLSLDANLIEWIIRKIEILRENNIPNVFVHGDFVPYNMKIKNGKLALIDWEYASEIGLPLFDLFTFLYQGGYQILNYKIEFLVDKIFDQSANNYNYFKKYLEKLNMKENMICPLFILYLAESLLLYLDRRSDAHIENNQYTKGLIYLMGIGDNI